MKKNVTENIELSEMKKKNPEEQIEIIESCPVCGSRECRKVLEVIDYFASKELFPVYDCTHCGFRFTNHFPSEDTIERYYRAADYISHSDSDKGLTNKLYHRFRCRMLH